MYKGAQGLRVLDVKSISYAITDISRNNNSSYSEMN